MPRYEGGPNECEQTEIQMKRWNLSVYDSTTASKSKLKRIARYFKGRQRCVLNCPWVGKLDDVIHVPWMRAGLETQRTRCSTSGGALAIGPRFTVRHWSVTPATVSLSSAESEAKAITKGCIEALFVKHLLEYQTARPFKIEVWTDSSSAKSHDATGLDQGAERNTWRCRRCGLNS